GDHAEIHAHGHQQRQGADAGHQVDIGLLGEWRKVRYLPTTAVQVRCTLFIAETLALAPGKERVATSRFLTLYFLCANSSYFVCRLFLSILWISSEFRISLTIASLRISSCFWSSACNSFIVKRSVSFFPMWSPP